MSEMKAQPDTTEDFWEGVGWAAGFFAIARQLPLGIDAGQRLMLDEIVRRLDQLESEYFAADEGGE